MNTNWEYHPLEKICKEITNGITESQIDDQTKYPVTRIETISDEKIDSSRVKYLQNVTPENIEKYRLKKGDLLFSHINSISHIGKTAFYENEPELLLHGMNLLKISPNTSKVLPSFLYAYTKYHVFRNRVKALAKKAINQASINQKEVGSIKVPLPPLVEQRGIAEVLGTVDEAIRVQEQIIGETESLKKGLMQRLITEGIGHTEYKETPIGKIPKTWKIESLKKHIKIQSGNYFKYEEFVPDGIRVLKIDNVSYNQIIWDTSTFLPENYLETYSDLVLNENDLVMALNRPITNGKLKIGIVTDQDTPSILYQRVGRFITKDNKLLNPKFLYYYMSTGFFMNNLRRIFRGTDQPYVNTSEIVTLMIPVPEISEQNKIVNIIENAEKLIENRVLQKDSIINVKQGLMQVLLSSERRVELREDGLHRTY